MGSFMLVRRAEGKGINSLFFWTHYFGFFSFWEEKKKIRDLKKNIFIRIIWWNIGILYYTIYLDFSLTNQREYNFFFFPPSKTWCESCKGFFYFGNDLRANGLIIAYLSNQFYCQGILYSNFVLALFFIF